MVYVGVPKNDSSVPSWPCSKRFSRRRIFPSLPSSSPLAYKFASLVSLVSCFGFRYSYKSVSDGIQTGGVSTTGVVTPVVVAPVVAPVVPVSRVDMPPVGV